MLSITLGYDFVHGQRRAHREGERREKHSDGDAVKRSHLQEDHTNQLLIKQLQCVRNHERVIFNNGGRQQDGCRHAWFKLVVCVRLSAPL